MRKRTRIADKFYREICQACAMKPTITSSHLCTRRNGFLTFSFRTELFGELLLDLEKKDADLVLPST